MDCQPTKEHHHIGWWTKSYRNSARIWPGCGLAFLPRPRDRRAKAKRQRSGQGNTSPNPSHAESLRGSRQAETQPQTQRGEGNTDTDRDQMPEMPGIQLDHTGGVPFMRNAHWPGHWASTGSEQPPQPLARPSGTTPGKTYADAAAGSAPASQSVLTLDKEGLSKRQADLETVINTLPDKSPLKTELSTQLDSVKDKLKDPRQPGARLDSAAAPPGGRRSRKLWEKPGSRSPGLRRSWRTAAAPSPTSRKPPARLRVLVDVAGLISFFQELAEERAPSRAMPSEWRNVASCQTWTALDGVPSQPAAAPALCRAANMCDSAACSHESLYPQLIMHRCPLRGSWACWPQGCPDHVRFPRHLPGKVASSLIAVPLVSHSACQLPGSVTYLCQDAAQAKRLPGNPCQVTSLCQDLQVSQLPIQT